MRNTCRTSHFPPSCPNDVPNAMMSMTGHGRGTAARDHFRATVECASVNRKSAEVVFVAPKEFAAMEPLIRQAVLERISRGRVSVNLAIEGSASEAFTIDFEAAKKFHHEVTRLKNSLGLAGHVDIATILAAPGVLQQNAASSDTWPVVTEALQKALDAMLAMRAREGKALQNALRRELRTLERLARRIAPLSLAVARTHQRLLKEKISRAGADPLDPRLASEIVLLASRADVSEELARLASHHAQFLEKLQAPGAVGRTLEFLCQEIAREWNTIGSKSADAQIAKIVVEAKTTVDRLREQLANVE